MKSCKQKLILGGCFLALASICTFGQDAVPDIPKVPDAKLPKMTFQQEQELECTKQPITEARNYKFRNPLPRDPKTDGAFGPGQKKPWYGKLFPWLLPADLRWSSDDIRVLQAAIEGHKIPIGESKRSYQLRMKMEVGVSEVTSDGGQKWQEWLSQHPTATESEKKLAGIRLRGLELAKEAAFDWGTAGLDLGPVGDQGWQCNTCWAFATIDAVRASRQLIAIRNGKPMPDAEHQPSVRQLLSCWLPEVNRFDINWHTASFSYLVEYGIPLGGSAGYGPSREGNQGWTCDSPYVEKALTWDYVTTRPGKPAKTDEIKRALITYGPIAATIDFDRCLNLYGGGIFNEQVNKKAAHILLIIGWDDSKHAWRVKNAYGEGWGERGYAWIRYDSNNIGKAAAWVFADPEPKREPRQTGVNTKF